MAILIPSTFSDAMMHFPRMEQMIQLTHKKGLFGPFLEIEAYSKKQYEQMNNMFNILLIFVFL
jgi:hypothetical protein